MSKHSIPFCRTPNKGGRERCVQQLRQLQGVGRCDDAALQRRLNNARAVFWGGAINFGERRMGAGSGVMLEFTGRTGKKGVA